MIYKKGVKNSHEDGLTEDQIIKAAKTLISKRFCRGVSFLSPDITRDFLITHYAQHEHEAFVCIFLDNQNRLILMDEMFTGTINSAAVYPREVLKKVLQLNAAAIIFAHNHPSGILQPSEADRAITTKLQKALSLIDVKVLDHFIVGAGEPFSFAEHSLI